MSEAGTSRRIRKNKYIEKLIQHLDEYKSILIVQVDNVGSSQMQKTRILLRGKAAIVMGKNTLMRKVIREQAVKNPALEALLPLIYGNVGLVMTNASLNEVRKVVLENKVPAAAKTGVLAPSDVFIPPGPTGLDPGQTAFFQALNIATKIVKGAIELVQVNHLIKVGEKVSSSHVALLAKLNILPFFYGFKVTDVYENGTVYSADILDMSQQDLLNKFLGAVRKLAAVSLSANYPTMASVPTLIAGSFAKIIALSIEADLEVQEAKPFKDYLANPDAFKAAAAASAPAASAGAAAAAAPAKKETTEESDEEMGFSLFD
jgi:large subunit ribosomal protein LP0